jgi:hypothetical protein
MNIKVCCGCPSGKEFIHCGCECHKEEINDAWYEVYAYNGWESHSIESFDTYEQALLCYQEKLRELKGGTIYIPNHGLVEVGESMNIGIDFWQNGQNPEFLDDVTPAREK